MTAAAAETALTWPQRTFVYVYSRCVFSPMGLCLFVVFCAQDAIQALRVFVEKTLSLSLSLSLSPLSWGIH